MVTRQVIPWILCRMSIIHGMMSVFQCLHINTAFDGVMYTIVVYTLSHFYYSCMYTIVVYTLSHLYYSCDVYNYCLHIITPLLFV